MRYTEARLEKVTQEAFLADLDKDVVDFIPNFDETEKEPTVLPAKLPNLLVNGSDGIAVGMATSIPPHNLGEVIDAAKAFLKDPDISTEELLKLMPGPDFPTGGIIINKDELPEIYETGVGKIKVRGRVEVEKLKGGREQLVITEIPYPMIGANIGKFLNDIAALVEARKAPEIVDISNQSSKEGIRIVLELKKGADTENLKNMLYKKTRLEDTFGVNMLAVADGRPETLGLKQILEYYIEFQYELTTRKYKTLLAKEQEKREIQEGLIKACDVIDLIIEILRGSKNVRDAKACLVEGITDNIRFKSEASKKRAAKLRFTERQATAILEMRLYKLIGLEIQALMDENAQTIKNIAEYEDILENHSSMTRVITQEMDAIKKAYARPRRTTVENAAEIVFEEKKIEEMPVMFLMDRFGYAKTIDMTTYERNKEAADGENKYVFPCINTGRICLFTDTGRMHTIKVQDLPFGKFRDKGSPIDNFSNYNSSEEQLVGIGSMETMKTKKLIFGTRSSMLKVVDGSEFETNKRTMASTKLAEDDIVLTVAVLDGNEQVVLQSEEGYFLRFAADQVPEKKKGAIGVRGMRLSGNDRLAAIHIYHAGQEQAIEYRDKQLVLNKIKPGSRDTKGVKVRV
jgi:DNA gyrase subunit A